MGVDGLWSLVNRVGKEVNLESCKEKRIAVDLSSWIVKCSSLRGFATNKYASQKPSAYYLCHRVLFMRTLNLLSLGISLVFIIDGPCAPAVKKKVKHREEFYREVIQYKELLTALGVPVLECDGEAEKMCAQLNHLKLVDGVFTDDGDALIYGAETVYKDLSQNNKNLMATLYDMDDITATLKLTRRDLVAFALLSAGDFSDGVPNVRDKRFVELMNEFRTNNISDSLDRLVSWSSNPELDSLGNKKMSLTSNKKRHCTKCFHEGTKQVHRVSGCSHCHVEFDCTESSSPEHLSCCCEYHVAEETVKAYKTELMIRDLALKSNPHFPDQEIIAEFLEPLPLHLADVNLSLRMPDFLAVCTIMKKTVHYNFEKTMSFLVPATIKLAFHGLLPDLTIRPMSIIQACKYKFEQCYLVKWEKFEQDKFSDESIYNIKVSQKIFALKYPEMVNQFIETSKSPVKRKCDNLKQETMTSYFKITKQEELQK